MCAICVCDYQPDERLSTLPSAGVGTVDGFRRFRVAFLKLASFGRLARASLGAARAVLARARRRLLLLLWRHALKHALRQRVHPALVAAQGRVWRATR